MIAFRNVQERIPRRSRLSLFLGLLVFLTGCAIPGTNEAEMASSEGTSPAEVSRTPVEVMAVQVEDITETLELTGTAETWDDFAVSSQIPGEVIRLEVEEGDLVQQGQLLLELDQDKRLLEFKSEEAKLQRARVDLGYEGKKLDRARALLEKGAISESEVDTLEQAVRLAESGVDLAKIQLDLLERELEDTRITAPVSGQVFRRLVSLGETINPTEPLFTIIQIDPVKVLTEVSESDLRFVRVEQEVRLDFTAFPDRQFKGVIHRIEPVANPRSGSFPVIVRVSNPRKRIQPGMVAGLALSGRTFSSVLTAPLDVVLDEGGSQFVYLVKDGAACRVDVMVDRRVGDRAILSGSLEAGDQLISRGNRNVTHGTPVEVFQ